MNKFFMQYLSISHRPPLLSHSFGAYLYFTAKGIVIKTYMGFPFTVQTDIRIPEQRAAMLIPSRKISFPFRTSRIEILDSRELSNSTYKTLLLSYNKRAIGLIEFISILGKSIEKR